MTDKPHLHIDWMCFSKSGNSAFALVDYFAGFTLWICRVLSGKFAKFRVRSFLIIKIGDRFIRPVSTGQQP